MSEAQIRIGIGGWTYPPWRGVFYPDKLPQAKELEYASRQLGAIEINATFYGRQKPEELGSLGEDRSRRLPVRGQGLALLRHALEAVRRRRRASAISSRRASRRLGRSSGRSCGCSRARRKFDRDDIAGFIDLLPAEARRNPAPPRDRAAPRELPRRQPSSTFAASTISRSCSTMIDELSVHRGRYRRLRLRPAAAHERGGADRLRRCCARRLRRARAQWAKDGRDAYIFMINGAKVRAPAAALALQERLR